jgi:hypothetical protein
MAQMWVKQHFVFVPSLPSHRTIMGSLSGFSPSFTLDSITIFITYTSRSHRR